MLLGRTLQRIECSIFATAISILGRRGMMLADDGGSWRELAVRGGHWRFMAVAGGSKV